MLNIEPPWGKCDQTIRLKWSEVYSFEQCAVECKLDYVVEECGCKPFYYPGMSDNWEISLFPFQYIGVYYGWVPFLDYPGLEDKTSIKSNFRLVFGTYCHLALNFSKLESHIIKLRG